MKAYEGDAKKLASQVHVPWELILTTAAFETKEGTLGIVNKSNNFFGLHVDSPKDKHHYAHQIDVYTTTGHPPAYVAVFAAQTGFFDSGSDFISVEKNNITNVTDLDAFARAVHAHGYGVNNPNYVSDFESTFGKIIAREECPQLTGAK